MALQTFCVKWHVMPSKHLWTVFHSLGTSLAVQQLGLCNSIAGGTGSTPGRGIKILQTSRCGQKKEKSFVVFSLTKGWDKVAQKENANLKVFQCPVDSN